MKPLFSVAILAAAVVAIPPLASAATTADLKGDSISLADLRAKYALPAGKILNIDGVDVYYVDEGSGPAVLLMHGSVSNLDTYDVIAARMKKKYRVIRYDIPAQGLSGPISDAAAARLKPADIAEKLLERLGVKHVTAVGVSSGGTLCFFLAAQRPDLVSRLILSNTPADVVDTSHLPPTAEMDAVQKEAAQTGRKSYHFWDVFLSYFAGDPARISKATKMRYYDMNRRPTEPNALALTAVVANHEKAVDAMSKVTAPTLLIWGGKDPLLTRKAALALEHYLTHADVSKVIMPDVGHYPPLEAPDRFANIVMDYMEEVTPTAQ